MLLYFLIYPALQRWITRWGCCNGDPVEHTLRWLAALTLPGAVRVLWDHGVQETWRHSSGRNTWARPPSSAAINQEMGKLQNVFTSDWNISVLKKAVLWDVAPRSLTDSERRFRRDYFKIPTKICLGKPSGTVTGVRTADLLCQISSTRSRRDFFLYYWFLLQYLAS